MNNVIITNKDDQPTDNIKTSINYLANLILENSGVHRRYSDEELSNVMIILQEVFISKMYDCHNKRLPQKNMEHLATEAGKSLHQTIKLFTGVDLHKVYNNK